MDIALSYQHISSRLISAILLAGLILALLMPLGITVGINTITFDVFFVLYSLIHLGAVVVALQILLRLCIDASRWPTLTAAISTLLLAILVLNCVPPITARDALVHHLAVPRLWLAAGHVYEIAWHDWSYYPMLLNGVYGFVEVQPGVARTILSLELLSFVGGHSCCGADRATT